MNVSKRVTRTGDLKLMQEINRSLILNTIRNQEPISKTEIAKQLSISPTTVSTAVSELIKEGFVREDGTGQSSGGRKPVNLRFHPDGKQIIAVSITNTDLTIGLLNMAAEIVAKKHYNFSDFSGEKVVTHTIQSLQEFLKDQEESVNYLGISITAPGIVDAKEGRIIYNSQLELHEVDFVDQITKAFQMKTWLENDVKALALAEKEFGNAYDSRHMVYVKISDGVGAGVVVNNHIFRGHNGGAGEFGHTSVDKNGIQCECGNTGCLEAYISWPSIVNRVHFSLQHGRKSILKEHMESGESLSPGTFIDGIEAGDPLCLEITEDVAGYLSAGLVNLVSLYNPGLIILGGEVIQGNDYLLELTKRKVQQKGIQALVKDLTVRSSELGKNYELIGSVSIVFQDLFKIHIHE